MARRTVSDLRALLEKLISPPHSFSIARLPATLEFIGEWTAQSLTNLLPIGRFHCNHQMARDSKIARRQRGARQSRRASVRSTGKHDSVENVLYVAVGVVCHVRHYSS